MLWPLSYGTVWKIEVALTGFEPALDGISVRCLCQVGLQSHDQGEATSEGLEPPSNWFEASCSDPLSYEVME